MSLPDTVTVTETELIRVEIERSGAPDLVQVVSEQSLSIEVGVSGPIGPPGPKGTDGVTPDTSTLALNGGYF